MFKISKLFWISKDAMEAEVTITDGVYELLCFSQPCHLKVNQQIFEPIYCMNNTNVVTQQIEKTYIEKLKEPFAYNITGKLINVKNGLVKVGQILIQIEKTSLPGAIKENQYLNFNCQRIDIY